MSHEQSELDSSPSGQSDVLEPDLHPLEEFSDDIFGLDEDNMYDRDGHDSFADPSYDSTCPVTPDGPAVCSLHSNLQLASANSESTYISQTLSAGHVDDTCWPWWNLWDYDPSIPLHVNARL
jgi:hypothetical protein